MDLAYIGYLLFVIPGFIVVWTCRHYTQASKIGEFEYAGWSFLWGVILFVLLMFAPKFKNAPMPEISLENPFAVIGSLIGIQLGIVIILSFPLGYLGAFLTKTRWIKWIDKKLFDFLKLKEQ